MELVVLPMIRVYVCLCQISWREFVRWSGEPVTSPEQLLEEKLIKVFVKAQDMGHSLQVRHNPRALHPHLLVSTP